jgi:hypothetical protein
MRQRIYEAPSGSLADEAQFARLPLALQARVVNVPQS